MRFNTALFNSAYDNAQDRSFKKRTLEEELAQKQQLLRYQADLENQALSPEEKIFRLYQRNPSGYKSFRQDYNALSPYQEAMLGIQRGQLDLQGQRIGAENTTTQQKNFQFISDFLSRLPGMTPEKAQMEAMDRSGLKKPPPSKEEEMKMLMDVLNGNGPIPGAAR